MNRTILFSILYVAATAASASTLKMSYVTSSEPLSEWGTERAETYSVAVRFDNPGLIGKELTSIDIPIVEDITATDCRVFVSKELAGNSGVAESEISVDFSPTPGLCRIQLPTPYTISGPFYAGYSLKITNADTEANKHPIAVAEGYVDNGMFVTTSRKYRKWYTSPALGVRAAIGISVAGDFPERHVAVSIDDEYSAPDTAAKGIASIFNSGLSPIESISYEYGVAGEKNTGTIQFDPPIAANFTSTSSFEYEIPAVTDPGIYEGNLMITSINGNPYNSSSTNKMAILTEIPKRKVVMEEFTGTWCGACPRGWVALELLSDKYGDDLIGIALHNNDVMTVTKSDPLEVPHYPFCYVDRIIGGDPYYGETDDKEMGICDIIDRELARQPQANLEIKGYYNDDASKITVKATAFYFRSFKGNPWQIQFLLTEDGMHGDGREWMQHNYFSGLDGYPSSFDIFTKGDTWVTVEFNDVMVATTSYSGVDGSQPDAIEIGSTAESIYEFDCSQIVNLKGMPLILDNSKINVVALLVDKNTREIINAAKIRLTSPTAVDMISDNGNDVILGSQLYDISGRCLNSVPEKGIYVEMRIKADGSREAIKHIR